MATFNDLIRSGKVKAAYLKRDATLGEISNKTLSIVDLDKETPNFRTFDRLETNANKSLEELKLANSELRILLANENPDISNDESYITDQKQLRKQDICYLMQLKIIFSCFKAKVLNIPLKLNL